MVVIDDFIIMLISKEDKKLIQAKAQKNNESLTGFCSNKILETIKK